MYEYYTEPLSKLPIHKIVTREDKDFEKKIIKLVERLIGIRKELLEQKDIKTDKSEELVNNIAKLENELNTLVYNLYGLTDSEIKIVEDSLK